MIPLIGQTQNIQVSLPALVTFGGVLAAIWLVVRIGDRLWRNGRNHRNGDKSNDSDALEKFGEGCRNRTEKLIGNMSRLSEAMTKYIELQQAALKIEEYRHDNILKQLEALSGKVEHADEKRSKDIAALHQRLDNILTSIVDRGPIVKPPRNK